MATGPTCTCRCCDATNAFLLLIASDDLRVPRRSDGEAIAAERPHLDWRTLDPQEGSRCAALPWLGLAIGHGIASLSRGMVAVVLGYQPNARAEGHTASRIIEQKEVPDVRTCCPVHRRARRARGPACRAHQGSQRAPAGCPHQRDKTPVRRGTGHRHATQEFATAQDMAEGAKVFAAMDPSETPGTRASIDECEVKLVLKV